MNTRDWEATEERQGLLKEMSMRGTVFDGQISGPDRTTLTKLTPKEFGSAGTLEIVWSSSVFAEPQDGTHPL